MTPRDARPPDDPRLQARDAGRARTAPAAEPGTLERDAPAVDRCVALIPAYNEAATVGDLIRRVRAQLPDVIVVDDGSADATAVEARRLDVRLVRHAKNAGKGRSLIDGLHAAREAGFDAAVTLDADGQHRARDIPRLLQCAGADTLVLGSRVNDAARMPRARRIANRIAGFFISWAAGQRIGDTQCGLRVYPTGVAAALGLTGRRHGFVFESEVLIEAARQGWRIVEVPVPAVYPARAPRHSYYRPVVDSAAIAVMVAGKLLARGLDPAALVRVLRADGRRSTADEM
ncbi:MAG: glycosyltransferase family 2 protein [Rhodovibrio sp.]|nr:glycosyltransferase family 2 protein [Rhodovibrio sp.]